MNKFIVIALLFCSASVVAQEISVGQTVRPGGVTGGEVYEISYSPNRWRYSVGHVAAVRYNEVASVVWGDLGKAVPRLS